MRRLVLVGSLLTAVAWAGAAGWAAQAPAKPVAGKPAEPEPGASAGATTETGAAASARSEPGAAAGAKELGAQTVAPADRGALTEAGKGTPEMAGEIVGSALQLQQRGEWMGAVKLLRERREACGEGTGKRSCRQVLDYAQGYVLQQASAGRADAEPLLRQAAESYENVLAQAPAHGPTLDSLVAVYQRLGEPDRAATVLRRALAADPAAAVKLSTQLGDLLLQSGSPVEARQLYARVLEQNPGDAGVCHRVVLSYELAPSATGADELLNWGKQWANVAPGGARDAYEAAIRLGYRSEPSKAEEALVPLVDLLGRSGRVSPADLGSLPSAWESAALRDLLAYLSKPEAEPPAGSWWQDHGGERSLALARLALGLGKDRLGGGQVEQAETVWRVGWNLTGRRRGHEGDAAIDLKTELAFLYFTHPELDRNGEKFHEIEEALFVGKGDAIARSDTPAIQRYHEALGLIYAQRGTWTSAAPWHNALFQLSSALEAAAKRDQADRRYQPLPWIRERLADGYRAASHPDKAVSTYVEACGAYLDVDDLAKAEGMLASARRVAGGRFAGAQEEIHRLSLIFATRRRLGDAVGSPQGGAGRLQRSSLQELAGSPWLAPGWPHPRPSFVERQRFKALADLALVAGREGGEEQLALASAQRAMRMVVERQVFLVGAGDLLRVQHLQAVIGGALGLGLEDPQVVKAGNQAGNALPVALPSGGDPTFVRVSRDAELASRIVGQIGVPAVVEMRPTLSLHDGAVVILKARPGTDLKNLLGIVKATPGVEKVALAESLRASR